MPAFFNFQHPKGAPMLDRIDENTDLENILHYARHAPVFRNPDGVPYVFIPGETINQSFLTTLRTRDFLSFLREGFHDTHGRYPSMNLCRQACDLLESRCGRRTWVHPPAALRVSRGNAERLRNDF